VVVLINTNKSSSSAMTFNFGEFNAGQTSVYQTWGTNYFKSLGTLTNGEILPPQSITTIVLDSPPVIGFQTSGSNLLLTWPTNNPGYALQFTTDLASGVWSPVGPPSPTITGTNYQLTLPPTNASLYFRLSK
jgi:hypothetical protein